MNKEQLYLTLLAEECTEVGKLASKSIRFGLDSIDPETGISNTEALHQELIDILSIVDFLNYEYGFSFDYTNIDQKLILKKKEKVERYLHISQRLGRVSK